MNPKPISSNPLPQIKKQLKAAADPKTKASGQRFFKEKIKLYGVKSAVVGKIAKENAKSIKDLPKADIFKLCEKLWQSGFLEETIIACHWSYAIRQDFQPNDFRVLQKWVNNYVDNWASCDTFCNHTIGAFIEMYPQYLAELKKWTQSRNRWTRRAAAVSLIVPVRRGQFLKDAIKIADLLLLDQDDLVQKGYGWLLKVAAGPHQKTVFNYIMRKKDVMPRTALRYAIEKMPRTLKDKAMVK